MAFVLADRVRETTTTTGTGTITLGGAAQSYQTFASAIGNTNTTYYAIAHQNANEFEVGLGTVSTSGSNTLARTTVLKSSNSNNAVDFSAGTKDVFVTYPSEKAVTTSDAQTLTNKTIDASQLSGTVANARLDAQLQDVAGLAVTNGNFIVGDGSNFVAESGATARTSLGLGTAAVLDTGISNTNIAKFTSGVADNDFLRVDGTDIEGRSASEVLSDIGAQAAGSNLVIPDDGTIGSASDTDAITIASDGKVTLAEIATAAKGVAFPATQVSSANANTLDDYEEGTFTATATVGGSSTTQSNSAGFYTKIGRICHITCRVTLTSLGSGTGTFLVSLPFTASNLSVPSGTLLHYGLNFAGSSGTIAANQVYAIATANAASFSLATSFGGSTLQVNTGAQFLANNTDFMLSLRYFTT
tara:strand:- start:303 stop:1547 length:1245 start_codon:yes stop_codon:yes gene_type:complete